MKKFLLIAVIVVANVAAEDNVRFGFENGFGARAFRWPTIMWLCPMISRRYTGIRRQCRFL